MPKYNICHCHCHVQSKCHLTVNLGKALLTSPSPQLYGDDYLQFVGGMIFV